jgi:hypothetical protein
MARQALDRELYDAVKGGAGPDAVAALLRRGADPGARVGKGGRTAVMRADARADAPVAGLLRAESLRRRTLAAAGPAADSPEVPPPCMHALRTA